VTAITARSVRVDGGRVLVVEAGEGPPVVLLHGLAGTFRYWLGTVRRLAGSYRVLAPDVPGFGGSDPAARPFDLAAAGARVLAACEAVGAERPIVAGHSLSGPLAALAAAGAPERVSGVVLVSAASLSPQRAWRRHVLLPLTQLALRRPRFCENLLAGHAAVRAAVFHQMFDDPRALPADETRMLVGGATQARQLRDSLETTLAYDLRPLLRDMPVPLGLVWGVRDRTAPFADAELVKRLRPEAPMRVLRETGHMPMLERPEAFAEALAAVLRALGSRAGTLSAWPTCAATAAERST
jgi:pimeloyl-ACP methyl ester carboxylesterase